MSLSERSPKAKPSIPSAAQNEYKCGACGGVFEKGWSDEEALDELGDTFPGFTPSDCGLVCDDCWQKYITPASGMEARRAAAENTDAVHDGPTAESGDAQGISHD